MKKFDYRYVLLIVIILLIVVYYYNYYNKEPMSSSVIGKDLTGKEFDITINNYPHMNLLRDKYISYYKTLTKEQKKKFERIIKEEQEKLERKKEEFIIIKNNLIEKISGLKTDMKNASNEAERKQLELKTQQAEKELQFQKEKEALEIANMEKQKSLESRLREEFDKEIEAKTAEINAKEEALRKYAEERLLKERENKRLLQVKSDEIIAKEEELRKIEEERLIKENENKRLMQVKRAEIIAKEEELRKIEEERLIKERENERLMQSTGNLRSDLENYKKLAQDRRTENERIRNDCETNRRNYMNEQTNKYNQLYNAKRNSEIQLNANYNGLNSHWTTKYNTLQSSSQAEQRRLSSLSSQWEYKYQTKRCTPVPCTPVACTPARRRRRRRWGWSDIRLKYDIKQIGLSPSGIPVVTYKYNDLVPDLTPHVTYQGVIAQHLLTLGLSDTVLLEDNGFYSVDYDKLDVEFKQV